jgi:hypothetical protein
MSPQGSSFIAEIAEAYNALELLPQAHERIATLERDNNEYFNTIQRLELKLIDRQVEIDNLNAKIRELEVARDDAEFRFLEAEDKQGATLRTLKELQGRIAGLVEVIDPPKVEPVVVEAPVTSHDMPVSEMGLSVTDPTLGEAATQTGLQEPSVSSGQSEPDPTAPTTTYPEPSSVASTAPTDPVSSIDRGPYFGKRYIHVAGYMSLSHWLAGGGTEEDYNWRPSAASNVA